MLQGHKRGIEQLKAQLDEQAGIVSSLKAKHALQRQQLTAQVAQLKSTSSQQVEIAVVHQQVVEQPRAAHMAVSLQTSTDKACCCRNKVPDIVQQHTVSIGVDALVVGHSVHLACCHPSKLPCRRSPLSFPSYSCVQL